METDSRSRSRMGWRYQWAGRAGVRQVRIGRPCQHAPQLTPVASNVYNGPVSRKGRAGSVPVSMRGRVRKSVICWHT